MTAQDEQIDRLLLDESRYYGLIVMDPNGVIRRWNAGAARITGYPAAEVLGKNGALFFTPEDVALGIDRIELNKARLTGQAEDERWHRRKDGTQFWANGVVTRLDAKNGELIGYSKLFRDDSLRKRTEDELKRSNAELYRFATVAAHDLQDPLHAVSGSLQLIQRLAGVEIGDLVQRALHESRRMRELITNILSLSRPGEDTRAFEEVECNAVVDEAIATLAAKDVCFARAALPVVRGIPLQLERLFQNLISNAIKYRSEAAPLIQIEAKRQGDEWLFSVKDNGIGIAPSAHAKIFEMFERFDPEGRREGTGVGLSICREIVERHGGRIWVDSALGAGATFYFTLPA